MRAEPAADPTDESIAARARQLLQQRGLPGAVRRRRWLRWLEDLRLGARKFLSADRSLLTQRLQSLQFVRDAHAPDFSPADLRYLAICSSSH